MRSLYSWLSRDVGEAADAVVRGDAELGLERLDEGVEHVEHAGRCDCSLTIARISGSTSVMNTIGRRPSMLGGVVDLAHDLVRLVGRVDERPAQVARLDRELREDRVAEGFGRDAGAVGDEEDRCGRDRCGSADDRQRLHRASVAARRISAVSTLDARISALSPATRRCLRASPLARHCGRAAAAATGSRCSRSLRSGWESAGFSRPSEPSHVIHSSGDRPGRPVRHPENDRRRGGRRQERLARRNDRPAEPRACACPAASRPPRMRFASSSPKAAWRGASPSGSPRSTPTTCVRSPRPAREIRGWIAGAAAARRRSRRRCGASTSGSRAGHPEATFAVRSSATAEDLPDASFAGQQETFLNVRGIDNVLARMREVFACLYNDRAISYRVHKGYAHGDVALSAGVQRMVRSDLGAAGVMFTLDTESGFRRRGVHHLELRPRRDGGAGRGQPRRVLRPQAGAEERQAGDHPPRISAPS